MASVKTATHPVNPALETRRTSVQRVQKVSESLAWPWCWYTSDTAVSLAVIMFTVCLFFFSSSRAFFDRAANMCVKVSGGVLCQPAERCVWGLPSRLSAVRGCSALYPLSEHSKSSIIPAGWTVCPAVCQVWSQFYTISYFIFWTWSRVRIIHGRARNKMSEDGFLTFPTQWLCAIKLWQPWDWNNDPFGRGPWRSISTEITTLTFWPWGFLIFIWCFTTKQLFSKYDMIVWMNY